MASQPVAREHFELNGWSVDAYDVLPSTNPIAGQLAPWSAVTADVQTGGRGRTGRVWVSDKGGLWLSACVPATGARKKWSILPLAAGWALVEALGELGLGGLRLRWPNDVLSGSRKLAGLLVEQYRPERVVVGIGLNVSNQPDALDQALAGHTVSLCELLPAVPPLPHVTRVVLQALRQVHAEIEADRFEEMARRINAHWDRSRRVELTLNNAAPTEAFFRGIDAEGRVAVESLEHGHRVFEASEVALLRELT